MDVQESNDDENGFVVEDLTPTASSTTLVATSGSETEATSASSSSPSKNTENLPVKTPNNALATTDKQNPDSPTPALNTSSNSFNNLPPLLPLSPISQQENCALGLNSNGVISPSSKISNGTESTKMSSVVSEMTTTGGSTTATTNSTEILVNQ